MSAPTTGAERVLVVDDESDIVAALDALRAGKPAIVSDPVPPHSGVQYAQAIEADLWLLGRDYNFSGDKQQWARAGRGRRYAGLAYPALRGANQLLNASGVLAAFEALRTRLLWVYEGLTQYLGIVLTARSGVWTSDRTREVLSELEQYYLKQEEERNDKEVFDGGPLGWGKFRAHERIFVRRIAFLGDLRTWLLVLAGSGLVLTAGASTSRDPVAVLSTVSPLLILPE